MLNLDRPASSLPLPQLGTLFQLGEKIVRKSRSWGRRSLQIARHRGLLGTYDLVFVVYEVNRGWILEAICREIATYFPGRYCFHYDIADLPPARAYFLSHYSLLPLCAQHNPEMADRTRLVWYTHPKPLDDIGVGDRDLYAALNQATRVICTCSSFEADLQAHGVEPAKTTHILGGADPDLFQPHTRSGGAVGFCMAYYPRKSPDLVLDIVRQMPHRAFILLGKGWAQYPRFAELMALPNFTYVEAPYQDYPQIYAQMDVFVSPSKLEGGPIPLIETMMCNIVPVASRTGFAPDIIRHGENGLIFDVESSAAEVCELIERAYAIPTDIRATVAHLSWKNFSKAVQACLPPPC